MSPRRPASRRAATDAGTRPASPRRASTSRAPAKVVGSGAVGPEAITSSGSPITSESASVRTLAGQAARASCPPLKRDRCLDGVQLADRRAGGQEQPRDLLLLG